MGVLVGHSNVHFFAHGHNILVSHPTEGLRIFLECEVSCLPFFEKRGQNVSRLAADDKEPAI